MPPTTLGMPLGREVRIARVFALGTEGQEEVLADLQPARRRGSAAPRRAWCRDRSCFPARRADPAAASRRCTARSPRRSAGRDRGSRSAAWARRSAGRRPRPAASCRPSARTVPAGRTRRSTPTGCARCSSRRPAAGRPWPGRRRSRAVRNPAADERPDQRQARRSPSPMMPILADLSPIAC